MQKLNQKQLFHQTNQSYKNKQYRNCLDQVQILVKEFPKNYKYRLLKANTLSHIKQLQQAAIEQYLNLILIKPAEPSAYCNLASLYHKNQQFIKAQQLYEECIAKIGHQPNDSAPFINYANYLVQTQIAQQQKMKKAIFYYEKAFQVNHKNNLSRDYNQKLYRNYAKALKSIKKQKPLQSYTKYLQVYPKDPQIYFERGIIYQELNLTKKSLDDFKQSLEIIRSKQFKGLSENKKIQLEEVCLEYIALFERIENLDNNQLKISGGTTQIETASFKINQIILKLIEVTSTQNIQINAQQQQQTIHQLKKKVNKLQNIVKNLEKMQRQVKNASENIKRLSFQYNQLKQELQKISNDIKLYYPQKQIQQKMCQIQKKDQIKSIFIRTLHNTLNNYFQSLKLIQSNPLIIIQNPYSKKSIKNYFSTFGDFLKLIPGIGQYGYIILDSLDCFTDKYNDDKFQDRMQIVIENIEIHHRDLCLRLLDSIIKLAQNTYIQNLLNNCRKGKKVKVEKNWMIRWVPYFGNSYQKQIDPKQLTVKQSMLIFQNVIQYIYKSQNNQDIQSLDKIFKAIVSN